MTTISDTAARLLALAERATPDVWTATLDANAQAIEEQAQQVRGLDHHTMMRLAATVREAKAYIAACDPQTISSLCKAVVELERDAERYRWLRDSFPVPSLMRLSHLNDRGNWDAYIDAAIATRGSSP